MFIQVLERCEALIVQFCNVYWRGKEPRDKTEEAWMLQAVKTADGAGE